MTHCQITSIALFDTSTLVFLNKKDTMYIAFARKSKGLSLLCYLPDQPGPGYLFYSPFLQLHLVCWCVGVLVYWNEKKQQRNKLCEK